MDSSTADEAKEKDSNDRPLAKVGGMARQGLEDMIRSKIGKIRHWKLTSLGKKRPKWGFEFTVMTYNILSQAAVNCHIYLYTQCNPQFLGEEYRLSRILPEILKSRSDVVCLQEVEQHLFDHSISKVFDSNGFGAIFKKRTGSKSDGCAILWRRAKFSLLRHQEVEFRAKGCEFLNRDNVGLIAVLRPTHPGAAHAQLHVGTTHLIFNPRRGDVKLCQLRLLLAELERSAFQYAGDHGRVYHPTVLCGDFNVQPHSPIYRFLEEGRMNVSGLVSGDMSGQQEGRDKGGKLFVDRMSLSELGIDESGRFGSKPDQGPSCVKSNGSLLSAYHRLQDASSGSHESDSDPESRQEQPTLFYHDFNLVPAYKYYEQDGRRMPVTSRTGKDCNTVDHIFYNVKQKTSTSYTEGQLKLLGVYTLPCAEELENLGGLPNAHLGSDHLSLMSRFMIKFGRR